MKPVKRLLLLLMLVSMLVVACSGGGPSNKELLEIIYGVYLQETKIQKKTQCPITEWLEDEGQTNVWLVKYQYKKSGKSYSSLFSEQPDGSWFFFTSGMDKCPDK